MGNREQEFQHKLAQVRALMAEKEIANLLITQAHHFSWLTGGGENFVFLANTDGAAPLLITQEAVYLVSNNIESVRMTAEELDGLPIEDAHHLWYLSGDEQRAHFDNLAPGPIYKDTELQADLDRLHTPLHDNEIERYRWLGAQAEHALRQACQSVEPGMTEYQAAALVAQAAYANRLYPVLILAAADERIAHFRHPLPTQKTIGRSLMLVLCARRHGLIANLTRMVSFGEPSSELRQKHDAVCRVDAALILASTPGKNYGEVFQTGTQAYEREGFAHEWKLHHQGGPTGYQGRYFKATAQSMQTVQAGQAIAWNPSIAGTKSEDTILVAQSGPEVLTAAQDWPLFHAETSLGALPRPDILIK